MIAVEWEREVPEVTGVAKADVPFGLQLSPETATLELNPKEWQALLVMMEMTVQ